MEIGMSVEDRTIANGHDSAQHESAHQAVLATTMEQLPAGAREIRGWDFDQGCSLDGIMDAMLCTGIQATALGRAVNEVNRMISWRLSDEPITEDTLEEHLDPELREETRCKIFLGYTSNLVSAGTREQLRYLVQHRMVDVIVSSAGGIEEDFIKCLAPTYSGEYYLKGSELRKRGMNRIGNMVVPNGNYCKFEDWIMPILDAMLEEQHDGTMWTPSKMIARLGQEINHEDSIYYWAWKNDIPVYSPALTDGSIGDMLFFHSYKNPGLVLDVIGDIRGINDAAIKAAPQKTGMIILGGGVAKHHICNANLFRNGADFSVFVNTAQPFDCSDSGADPDEAVSWGKIRIDAEPVKVYGDASIMLPLIISQTFAKNFAPCG